MQEQNSEHPVIIPHIDDNIALPKNAREALPDMSPEEELSMRSNTVKLISDLAGQNIEPSQDNMEQAEEVAKEMMVNPKLKPDFDTYPNETIAYLAGMVAQTSHMVTKDLANIKLKEMILNNKIGNPQYFHVEYSQKKNIPLKIFNSWAEHSNIFQYLAVHYVDIIDFVTDATPLRVMALGQKEILIKQKLNTYDSIQAMIEWKMGEKKFTSTILCNWIDPNSTSATSYQSIKVIGSKGRIESDQKNRGYQVISDDGIEDINLYFNQGYRIENKIYFRGYGIDSILHFLTDCNSIINKSN